MNSTTILQKETHQDVLFRMAMERIAMLEMEIQKLRGPANANAAPSTIRIHQTNRVISLPTTEVLYIQAEDNYSRFFLKNGTQYYVSRTLKSWMNELNSDDFVRCHRTYLVNRHEVTELNRRTKELILRNETRIPTSRRFQKNGLSALFSPKKQSERADHKPKVVIHKLSPNPGSPRG